MGGTSHTCSSECEEASTKGHQYFIFCDCEKGCKYCEDGKIYIYECPYNYIDNEIIIFKQMYSKYKEGHDLYGSFNELPYILWQYFNLLETELDLHQKERDLMNKETSDIADYINSGKR